MLRLLSIGLRLLSVLFRLFPVRRRVAMLSRQGAAVSADFRMLEERLRELDPTLPVVIRTSNSEKDGIVQLAVHLVGQLWYATTSSVVVLDGYNPVVCVPPKRKGVFVIQIWHAVGAIKKFGFQCLDTPAGRSAKYARLAHMHENYDLIVAGGPGAIQAYTETFGYPSDRVVSLGLPRMDLLLQGPSREDLLGELSDTCPWLENGNLNALYAPTLRQDVEASVWLVKAVRELAMAFDGMPVNLIVSKHPLVRLDDTIVWPDNVHFVRGGTTEGLMRLSDVLITDYSAVGLEAGLVGTPAVFFCPDIDAYRTSPGLNVDPLLDERLTGFAEAQPLADVICDDEAFGKVTGPYLDFVSTYFEGFQGDATGAIAGLILDESGRAAR